MVRTTRLQREALLRVFSRNDPYPAHPINIQAWWRRYITFRRGLHPTVCCDGAVTVHWAGMWLCIESDGYTHS